MPATTAQASTSATRRRDPESFENELKGRIRSLLTFFHAQPDRLAEAEAKLRECLRKEQKRINLPDRFPLAPDLILVSEHLRLIWWNSLTQQHPALASLVELRATIQQLIRSSSNPQGQFHLRAIGNYYQDFLTQFIAVGPKQRAQMLEPKARLFCMGIGFHLIPPKLARQIFCRDRRGNVVKSIQYGKSDVQEVRGVHFKSTAKHSRCPIQPATDYAISTFCQLLAPPTPCPIATPSTLLKVSRVPIGGELKERLVQASYTIGDRQQSLAGGMSLMELLETQAAYLILARTFKGRLPSVWKQIIQLGKAEPEALDHKETFAKLKRFMASKGDAERAYDFRRSEKNLLKLPEEAVRELWEKDYSYKLSSKTWLQLLQVLEKYPELMHERSLAELITIPTFAKWIDQLYPGLTPIQQMAQLPLLLSKVDKPSFSALATSSIIFDPFDGRADNYAVHIERDETQEIQRLYIVSIDSDEALKERFSRSLDQHYVEVKCILFLLTGSMGETVDSHVRQVLSQPPEELMAKWFVAIDQRAQEYQRLIAQGVLPEKTLDIPLELPKKATARLWDQLQKAHMLIRQSKACTHQELFNTLNPLIAEFYKQLCKGKGRSHALAVQQVLFHDHNATVEQELGPRLKEKEHYRSELPSGRVDDSTTPFVTQAQEWIRTIKWNALSRPAQLKLAKLLAQCSFVNELSLPTPQFFLLAAMQRGWPKVAALSLASGAKVDACDRGGMTPLHHFAAAGPENGDALLAVLMKHNIDFEVRDGRGDTPLDVAIARRKQTAFMQLVRCGAGRDVNPHKAIDFVLDIQEKPERQRVLEQLLLQSREVRWYYALHKIADPTRQGVVVQGLHTGSWSLKATVAQKLRLTKEHTFLPVGTEDNGRRPVRSLRLGNLRLHFKPFPELPLFELAVRLLGDKILPDGMPKAELFKFIDRNGRPYPVLISETIGKENLRKTLKTKKIEGKIDRAHLHSLILLTLVILTEDGKPDNYVALERNGKYRIVCIDNDHAFVEALKKGWRRVPEQLFKTILLCFDEARQPIDPDVRRRFLALDLDRLLGEWIEDLLQLETRAETLFKEWLYLPDFDEQSPSFVNLPIPAGLTGNLLDRLYGIQRALRKNSAISPLDLARIILGKAAAPYEEAFSEVSGDPLARFNYVAGTSYGSGGKTKTTSRAIIRLLGLSTADLKTGNYGPKLALKEFETIKLQSRPTHLKSVAKELQKGNVEPFRQLLCDELRRRVLDTFDISYAKKEALVIEAMGNAAFPTLSFKNSTIFSERMLDNILRNSQGRLTHLDLSGCQKLTSIITERLFTLCPHLSHVRLDGLPLERSLTLSAPNLSHLSLQKCWHISRLELDAPKLFLLLVSHVYLESLKFHESAPISQLNGSIKSRAYRNSFGGPDMGYELNDIKAMAETLRPGWFQNIHLREVNLCGNLCGDDGAIVIADVLGETNTLEVLDLSCNHIGPKGARALGAGLALNASLRDFSLNGNPLGSIGAQDLSTALMRNTVLKRLNLYGTNLGFEGAQAIGRALVKNRTLTWLDLSYNWVGVKGLTVLATALRKNCSLTHLSVGWSVARLNEKLFPLARRSKRFDGWDISLESPCDSSEAGKEDAIQERGSLPSDENETNIAVRLLGKDFNGGKNFESLSSALAQHNTLLSQLAGNSLGIQGVKALYTGFAQSESLTHFVGHALTQRDAKALGRLFAQHNSLDSCAFHCQGSDEGIEQLAHGITQNSSLQSLYLKFADINAPAAKFLGTSLAKNSSLHWLRLDWPRINLETAKTLGVLFEQNKSLNTLRLEVCPPWATVLERVLESRRFLHFKGVCLGDKNAEEFFGRLSKSTTLEHLGVGCNNFSLQGAQGIAALLRTSPSVTSLNLNGNVFGDRGIKTIASALATNTRLKDLRVGCNGITPTGLQEIASALHTNTTLTNLSLRQNSVGLQGATILASALVKNSRLTILSLCGTGLGWEGIKTISRAFIERQTVTNLNLSCNRNRRQSVFALARMLEQNTSLTRLYLGSSAIKYEEIGLLARGCASNSTIKTLDLRGNRINLDGLKRWAAALSANSCLRQLKLELNSFLDPLWAIYTGQCGESISLEGISVHHWYNRWRYTSTLNSALYRNTTLRTLNLTGVGILALWFDSITRKTSPLTHLNLRNNGILGLSRLCEAVAKNRSLICLDLSENFFEDKGIIEFCPAVSQNRTLTELHLNENKIGDKGLRQLSVALLSNSSLRKLNLKKNAFGLKGLDALGDAFTKNSALTNLSVELDYNSKLLQIYGRVCTDCDLGYVSKTETQWLAAALSKNRALTKLSLKVREISGTVAKTIGLALANTPSLTKLTLSDSEIDDQVGKLVGPAVTENSALIKLALVSSSIKDKGLQEVSAALTTNSWLKKLDLRSNHFGYGGIKALTAAFNANSSLRNLDLKLGCNRKLLRIIKGLYKNTACEFRNLRWQETVWLGGALERNSTVTSLTLRNTHIGDGVAKALGTALRYNTALTSLDLSIKRSESSEGKPVDNGGAIARAIAHALRRNTSLTILQLEGVDIPKPVLQSIQESLKGNKEKRSKALSK